MKSLAKRMMRSIWRLTAPVRGPISRRASLLIRRSTEPAIREATEPALRELLIGVATARREVGTYRNETNLLLNSLVRELTRLQDEVAALRDERANEVPSTIPIATLGASSHGLADSA